MQSTDGFNKSGSANFYDVPLTPARKVKEESIGALIKDTLTQTSYLIKAELSLAKQELSKEVKKGAAGGVLLIIGVSLLAFSSFFFFVTVAEILSNFMARWISFVIVFVAILVICAIIMLISLKVFKSIRKPEKTIDALKTDSQLLTKNRQNIFNDSTETKPGSSFN